MIKVSDYVFQYLREIGVKTVFTLTGGGIMHLVESMGSSGMEYVCCHHEQACSIAAQAYSMYEEELCVCLVTTGPGGTNALTGLAAAYADSTPMLFISGQVKMEDFASLRGVRQYGAQENDIISMAQPVCKYAHTVLEASEIKYHLQKAVSLATTARKGPVWIDIPLNIQAELVDEKKLLDFKEENKLSIASKLLAQDIDFTVECLKQARRPLLLLGQGVLSSKAAAIVEYFVRERRIPVVTTWRAMYLYDSEDELFYGSPGLQAPRYSNLITQGCDLLLVLGSRLDNMITAFNEEHFACRAKKIVVDIDTKELEKFKMSDLHPVLADISFFMEELNNHMSDVPMGDTTAWIKVCQTLKKQYPIKKEIQDNAEAVDLYQVTDMISNYATRNDTIVISSTSRCNTAGHIAFSHKKGQHTISSMGMGSMGFALPAAIGAYYANGKQRVIVIEGDGSFQLNIQELQTIRNYNINSKLFIFNNSGYAAIKVMQDRNFSGHHVGSTPQSGVTMPDLEKIANAYDVPYFCIRNEREIEEKIRKTLETEGVAICNIIGSLNFDEIPKCISSIDGKTGKRISANLENPYPFLDSLQLEEIFKKIESV